MAAGFGDMSSLLKQAQGLQKRLQETERDLAERILEGSAGGGAVKVYVNGAQEVQAVKISKDAVDPDDVETLEDLVLAAITNASEEVRKVTEAKMGPLSAGLGGGGLPF